MPAHTPKDVHRHFAEMFTAKDLEGLVSLYEPDAVLLPAPGQPVAGHAAIRDALGAFLALGSQFELHPDRILEAGDVALLFSRWKLSGTDPDGNPVELGGLTSDVVRRQPDGTWLLVIDNPFGQAS